MPYALEWGLKVQALKNPQHLCVQEKEALINETIQAYLAKLAERTKNHMG